MRLARARLAQYQTKVQQELAEKAAAEARYAADLARLEVEEAEALLLRAIGDA